MRKTKKELQHIKDLRDKNTIISNLRDISDALRVKIRKLDIDNAKLYNELNRTQRELKAIKEALIRAIEYSNSDNRITFGIEPRIANECNIVEKKEK